MSREVQVQFCERAGVRFPCATRLVLGFESKADADKVHRALFKRFEKFGLKLHPEKTRLMAFGHPGKTGAGGAGNSNPETFDFLGFTHYWRKSHEGRWYIGRKTARKRLCRSLKRIAQWCRENRDMRLVDQVAALNRKIKGHCGYFGITGNGASLRKFHFGLIIVWRKWLNRRTGQRGSMPWDRMHRLLAFFRLEPARVVHSVYAAKP